MQINAKVVWLSIIRINLRRKPSKVQPKNQKTKLIYGTDFAKTPPNLLPECCFHKPKKKKKKKKSIIENGGIVSVT